MVMESSHNYSEEELNKILNKATDEFRRLIECDDFNKWRIPDPNEFAYIHSFNGYDNTSGGILIIGLNPHTFEKKGETSYNKKKDEELKGKWMKEYCIDKDRNTSDCLLTRYPYFKLFTGGMDNEQKECNECPVNIKDNREFKMNLRKIDPNIKFTDAVLIRSNSRNKLTELLSNGKKARKQEEDAEIYNAIEIGWNKYLSDVLKLIRPKVVVCNSTDLSHFIEKLNEDQGQQGRKGEELKEDNRPKYENQTDVVDIKLPGDITIPFVLSGQVTGQRAIDKWTLIRMKDAIARTYNGKV